MRLLHLRFNGFAALLALAGLLDSLVAGTASAIELRDAELISAASPVLQNASGTVRIEDARLGRLGPPVFVPEPSALWQLGFGIGLLALLAGRRKPTFLKQRLNHLAAPTLHLRKGE